MRFVIITGLSGAGKTQALKAMEDMGFFCIDNFPPALIPKLADLFYQSKNIDKVALGMDLRGGQFFEDIYSSLDFLKKNNYDYEIVFLEASDEVLIKRFKETRRRHPLSEEGRIVNGINEERKRLSDIRKIANYIIDTSNLTSSQLKEELSNIFLKGKKFKGIIIDVMSFGYKYGIPLEADLVFDVRFLPNPFYIDELRPLTGNDEKVKEYVMKWEEAKEFLEKLGDMIKFLIPYYIREGKSQLVIAIGCTGGKHRSVAISNALYDLLKKEDYSVVVNHRDIGEE
ncbi:glmZ(sRNA)-inactivating NTPase [Caldanaerobacter subterraneus subsp. yonseiensis KB-1]|uniref:GlmZ(SRNA)-inactivating NTPase n=1 Tax=Caldanaerobacter subterraneus subsp. yonseiensis KB-1 TaxID=1388761 RepID=U5CT57_CALSX|nr:RNase adapter RapZ [Caldanaerobacter subterraneus]ERM93153.1 glmZ(sRNA)-inactivating NTPase [Caldanaerobacter subterraneus subsp. yonseiensis KB-1]